MNNLTGTVPADLAQLSQLTYLRLESNTLSGSIPNSLAQMAGLSSFKLVRVTFDQLSRVQQAPGAEGPQLQAGCQLNGTIPGLSNMSNLAEFSASNNQLTGTIPADWAASFRLLSFEVDNNRLHGTLPPPSTGDLYGVHRAPRIRLVLHCCSLLSRHIAFEQNLQDVTHRPPPSSL